MHLYQLRSFRANMNEAKQISTSELERDRDCERVSVCVRVNQRDTEMPREKRQHQKGPDSTKSRPKRT